MKRLSSSLAVVAAFVLTMQAAAGQTLNAVKQRGVLNCGVGSGILGFSATDEKGAWSGFDVDFCRAIAAAIFRWASFDMRKRDALCAEARRVASSACMNRSTSPASNPLCAARAIA